MMARCGHCLDASCAKSKLMRLSPGLSPNPTPMIKLLDEGFSSPSPNLSARTAFTSHSKDRLLQSRWSAPAFLACSASTCRTGN
uniref:Uncharacterized protein n=1 Tax=Anguilla anguilla TaxID=7936 RepID=A0A0E9SC33_ANGAN